MKSCPKCNRTFPDEGQKFCTFDGGLLIAPQTFDPNATIRATSIDLGAPEKATSRELPDPNATIVEQFPATIALPRNTGPTSFPNTADITPPPQPPPPPPVAPPPPVQSGPPTAPVPPPPQQTPAAVHTTSPTGPISAKKKSKAPLIIALVLVLLLLGGGGLAAVFFFVVKPRMDQRNANANPSPTPVSTPSPIAQNSPSPEPSPTQTDTFVPPADSVQFVNFKETLDGKLAERFFDFSFYYPKSWLKDPKSGVPGARNFVLVERALATKETQENVAVSWYDSKGTVAGDLQNFPKLIDQVSASLAKNYDGYEKISDNPTKVNSLDAYEFRWKATAELPSRGPVELWGRVIFIPTGHEGDTTGAALFMFSTSLAEELVTVDDVGEKGQAPMILKSFRFGKKE